MTLNDELAHLAHSLQRGAREPFDYAAYREWWLATEAEHGRDYMYELMMPRFQALLGEYRGDDPRG